MMDFELRPVQADIDDAYYEWGKKRRENATENKHITDAECDGRKHIKRKKDEKRADRIKRLGGYTREELEKAVLCVRHPAFPLARPTVKIKASYIITPESMAKFPTETLIELAKRECMDEIAANLMLPENHLAKQEWQFGPDGTAQLTVSVDAVQQDA